MTSHDVLSVVTIDRISMAKGKEFDGAFELSGILTPASSTARPPYALFPDDEPDETEGFMSYTSSEERTVINKLDRRLVLFVAFLYMLSFLDRSSKHAYIN